MQTANSIEARNSEPEETESSTENSKSEKAPQLRPYHFKPGQSGNPGGRPKMDEAAKIARAVFENNPAAVYQAMAKALLKGNAYAYSQLADRAYGKLKESVEVTHLEQDTPDADLSKRIADLERDLGLAREIDEAGRVGITKARAGKTKRKTKDTELLPG